MIDLSNAKVGDKFETRNGHAATIIAKAHNNNCLAFSDGSLMLCRNDGTIATSGSIIISKHEPRQWLKDMPDADLIRGQWIACDNNLDWMSYDAEPYIQETTFDSSYEHFVLEGFKGMPKLKGDEWKDSKISIDELREWQKENK